jgi:hypothetical protein
MRKEFPSELEALNYLNNNYSNKEIKNYDIQYRVISSLFKKRKTNSIYDYILFIIENYNYLVIDTFSMDLGNQKIYLFDNILEVL